MVDRVAPPSPVIPIADDMGNMEASLRSFTQKLAARALIIGSGNPESVIQAEQGALFMDEDAASGDVLYIKRLSDIGGDKTQGWRAV